MTDLTEKAKQIRREILEMCHNSGLNHLTPALSCVELLVSIYYNKLFDFSMHSDERDRFILSKGHANTALFAILADLGFFPKEEIQKLCNGGILGGHLENVIPGVEVVSGSLGHGLGIGAGIALRAKLDNKKYNTIVLMSDGECYEGSVWEAAMFIAHHKLNVIGIIDRNMLSASGFTEENLKLEPFTGKWFQFGWNVDFIDGHSFEEILQSLNRDSRPQMIIANTIKGKGISFAENEPLWHVKVPSGNQLTQARRELM